MILSITKLCVRHSMSSRMFATAPLSNTRLRRIIVFELAFDAKLRQKCEQLFIDRLVVTGDHLTRITVSTMRLQQLHLLSASFNCSMLCKLYPWMESLHRITRFNSPKRKALFNSAEFVNALFIHEPSVVRFDKELMFNSAYGQSVLSWPIQRQYGLFPTWNSLRSETVTNSACRK